jgi:hypothetical protein
MKKRPDPQSRPADAGTIDSCVVLTVAIALVLIVAGTLAYHFVK